MSELKTERETLLAKIEAWRQEHPGKFVLIKGRDAVGFYDSLAEAFAAGSEKFGLEPFLVEQINPRAGVNVSFFGGRLLATR